MVSLVYFFLQTIGIMSLIFSEVSDVMPCLGLTSPSHSLSVSFSTYTDINTVLPQSTVGLDEWVYTPLLVPA